MTQIRNNLNHLKVKKINLTKFDLAKEISLKSGYSSNYSKK